MAFCQNGRAQQQNASGGPLQREIIALKADIQSLSAQQRQILERLSELKQLLAAKSAAQPSPQPSLPSALAIQHQPFRGNDAARVTIIEFGDFECPYCGQFESEVYPQIAQNYINAGKVRYFFRDLPLPMHSHAMPAARAARCAGEQDKFWEMHDSLFANQASLTDKAFSDRAQVLGLDTAKFQECLSSQRYLDDIRNSMAEGQRMGIEGTPTFLLGTIGPDGGVVKIAKGIRGALPYEAFRAALDELLAQTEQEK